MNIRRNDPHLTFSLGKDERIHAKLTLTITAGLLDSSKPLSLQENKDAGSVPKGVFECAEKKLSAQIVSAFEKCKSAGCDLFGVLSHLKNHEKKRFNQLKDTCLQNTILQTEVRFIGVR